MYKTINEIKTVGKSGIKVVRINKYNRETNKPRLDAFLAELGKDGCSNVLVTETESEYQIKTRSNKTHVAKYYNAWRGEGENPYYKVVQHAEEQNPGALVSNPRIDPEDSNFILVDVYGKLENYSIHKWDRNPVEFGTVTIRSNDYYFVPEGKIGKEFGQSLKSENLIKEDGYIVGWVVKEVGTENVFMEYRFSGE